MNRINYSTLLMVIFLIACSALMSNAEVTLDIQLVAAANLEVFFLEDLNITGGTTSEIVFRVTVDNPDPPYNNCHYFFAMRDIDSYIASGQSNQFTLDTGVETFNNLDLTGGQTLYSLDDYTISDEATEIEDKLMQTGYFPTGTYFFRLELWQDNQILASDEVSITITNPFDIYLITPSGSPASPALVTATTPLFAWTSSASQFRIRICELTMEAMDPESVMEGRPHYETDPGAPLTTPSFIYPGAGVRPLESGHTYYWQVLSLVQTSSGLDEYPSPIGAFTVFGFQTPEAQRVAGALQRILGLDFQHFAVGLAGYEPTGTVEMNGSAITLDELQEIVNRFENETYKVTSVNIE